MQWPIRIGLVGPGFMKFMTIVCFVLIWFVSVSVFVFCDFVLIYLFQCLACTFCVCLRCLWALFFQWIHFLLWVGGMQLVALITWNKTRQCLKARKISLTFKFARASAAISLLIASWIHFGPDTARCDRVVVRTAKSTYDMTFVLKSTFYGLCIDSCAGRCRAITIVRFCVWSANLERIIKWSTARTNLFRVVLYLKTSCHHGTLRKHYTTTMNPNAFRIVWMSIWRRQ